MSFEKLNPLKRRCDSMEKIMKFFKDEEGASAVEYGILVAAIAAVIIAIVFVVGGKVSNGFQNVNAAM